jgi:isoleucyl-tRNA synthetase
LIRVQVVCIGSIAELEELTGVTGLTDIHREKIDHLTIPSKMGKGVLRRVEEVFDCWFESGRYLGSPILQTVLTT